MAKSKKNRNIIIWALTWAVLFLVVAYSPIGRPDLYVGTSYYRYNQGVSFKGGIANAPSSKLTTQTADAAEIEPTTYTPLDGNEASYEGSASKFTIQNASGTVNQDNKSTNYSQQSTGGAALGFSSTRQQAQGKATAQNGDVSSLSSSLTLNSTATNTRQTAPIIRNNGGGTDIGGDPIEQPIPVGDGMWFLLIMAGAYVFWKKDRATKANITTHK